MGQEAGEVVVQPTSGVKGESEEARTDPAPYCLVIVSATDAEQEVRATTKQAQCRAYSWKKRYYISPQRQQQKFWWGVWAYHSRGGHSPCYLHPGVQGDLGHCC